MVRNNAFREKKIKNSSNSKKHASDEFRTVPDRIKQGKTEQNRHQNSSNGKKHIADEFLRAFIGKDQRENDQDNSSRVGFHASDEFRTVQDRIKQGKTEQNQYQKLIKQQKKHS
ncbi:MAG: hypothetical protein VB031_08510 [Eubacteriaceae bacterium]|nr:hypothetical protein [Eubacteriaceae bacterium]